MGQKEQFRIKLVTCVIVFVILVLVLTLFRVEKRNVESAESEEPQLFSIMPRSEVDVHLIESEARDDLDDPTIMNLPNLRYGFSQIRIAEGEPPRPQLPVYFTQFQEIPQLTDKRTPLVGVFNEPKLGEDDFLVKPELSPLELEPGMEAFSKRVVWLEDNLEKLCPLDLKEIEKFLKSGVPTSFTKVVIAELEESQVAFLANKCGVPALDSLVLGYVKNKLKDLFIGKIDAVSIPQEIFVDWRLFMTDAAN